MRVIISPAKTMKIKNDDFINKTIPIYINDTEKILKYLRGLDYHELKTIWKASDKLTSLNYERIRSMDLYKNLTPAILAFEGLQYSYMAPGVFNDDELDYIGEHLRILSGFYGLLRPLDGVVPYRLEMQSKLLNWKYDNLYEFWGYKIAENLYSETSTIIDLASKEYSRLVSRYLNKDRKMIELVFGELIDGRIKEKATPAKMARGEMVRFMAEKKIKKEEDLIEFNGQGFSFARDYSTDRKYVFLK